MKKKQELSKTFYLVAKILTIVAIVGAAIGIIGLIVVACLPSKIFEGLTTRIKLSGVTLVFPSAVISSGHTKMQLVFNVLRGFILAAISFVICFFIAKILKNVSNGKLFDKANGKFVIVVGVAIALLSVAPNGLNFLTDLYILEVAGGNAAIEASGMTGIKLDEQFVNVPMLLIGVLVVLLSYIFKRGSFLQDEFDSIL